LVSPIGFDFLFHRSRGGTGINIGQWVVRQGRHVTSENRSSSASFIISHVMILIIAVTDQKDILLQSSNKAFALVFLSS
jgi:hypothetical protein